MRIAAVVVNFRTADATTAAVFSLDDELRGRARRRTPSSWSSTTPPATDPTRSCGRRSREPKWADRVVDRCLEPNGGFGYGVNVGFRYVVDTFGVPEYFYLLNPDATVEPGALAALAAIHGRPSRRRVGGEHHPQLVGGHHQGFPVPVCPR